MSDIDKHLTAAALELLERLEAALAPKAGAVILLYNKEGRDLDLTVAVLNGAPSEELRILKAAHHTLLERHTAGAPVRRYVQPTAIAGTRRLVSSMAISTLGAHDYVRVWSHGGHAGELVLSAGDGEILALKHGLELEH